MPRGSAPWKLVLAREARGRLLHTVTRGLRPEDCGRDRSEPPTEASTAERGWCAFWGEHGWGGGVGVEVGRAAREQGSRPGEK